MSRPVIDIDTNVSNYSKYLDQNGNLNRFATNFDNNKSPIHRWFPFLAGFSNLFVKETLNFFNVQNDSIIFDPFIGSGTTAIVGKELGFDVWGNEINKFLYDICYIKVNSLNYLNNVNEIEEFSKRIINEVSKNWDLQRIDNENPILKKCFPLNNLKKLTYIREIINQTCTNDYLRGILFMALTRSLTNSASVSINVPYVSWTKTKTPRNPIYEFQKNINLICEDMLKSSQYINKNENRNIFLHDSRCKNTNIRKEFVDYIFTSPPYLNNFDYGESLKVFLYFWKYAQNCREITEKIRKVSVTSSTTYYNNDSKLNKSKYEEILGNEMYNYIPNICEEIVSKSVEIRSEIEKRKTSKKSFDYLTLLYFKDMYYVFKELFRILKKDSLSFIIIGDSAPYGVHIPTDTYLAEIALGLGFSSYSIKPLRERGTKWNSLKYRHAIRLRESLLILRK